MVSKTTTMTTTQHRPSTRKIASSVGRTVSFYLSHQTANLFLRVEEAFQACSYRGTFLLKEVVLSRWINDLNRAMDASLVMVTSLEAASMMGSALVLRLPISHSLNLAVRELIAEPLAKTPEAADLTLTTIQIC